jgi:hypothetical protein
MRRWRFRLLPVAVLLLLGLAAPAEAGVRLYLPGGPSVVAWDPSESYAGKAEADPRLDRPVRIWRAGITLAEVFATAKQQTGVEIGFWPSDDLNTRLRANLYLNPDEPPPLRALMVQLAWVVGTSYAVTDGPAERAYFLMSTSIAGGAEYSAARRREERVQERELIWEAMDAKLDEYRQALALSREELANRYRGTDDFMLLNLLDPARRAALRLACRHLDRVRPAEGADNVDMDGWATGLLGPGQSTPDDVADLQAAFGEVPSSVTVEIFVPSGRQRLSLIAGLQGADSAPGGTPTFVRRLIVDLPSHAALTADEEVDLRRALGQQTSPAQAAQLVKQRRAQLQTAGEQLKQLPGSTLSEAAR